MGVYLLSLMLERRDVVFFRFLKNRLLACSMFGNERHISVLKCRGFDLCWIRFYFEALGCCVFDLFLIQRTLGLFPRAVGLKGRNSKA